MNRASGNEVIRNSALITRPNNTAAYSIGDVIQHHIELLINGNFETETGGDFGTWVETASNGAIAAETSTQYAGAKAAKITAGAAKDTKIVNTFAVLPLTSYTLTFQAKNGTAANAGRYSIVDATGSANIVALVTTGVLSASWTLVTVTFTTPASCVSCAITFMCPDADTKIAYFDDAHCILTGSISEPLVFSACARENGDGGLISQVTIIDSVQAATPLTGELWLFTATLTPAEDNAAFAPTDAQSLTCVGVIPFTTAGYLGSSNVVVHITNFGGLVFQCAENSTNLYGVLVARNAYAPAALETFQVRLHIMRE